jgi:hypothetical protein
MKLKHGAMVLAGALVVGAAMLPTISEGRGRGPGGGPCGRGPAQCQQQSQNCPQERQRLRDGSCGNAACPQQGAQRGPCPGPAAGRPCPGPQAGDGGSK